MAGVFFFSEVASAVSGALSGAAGRSALDGGGRCSRAPSFGVEDLLGSESSAFRNRFRLRLIESDIFAAMASLVQQMTGPLHFITLQETCGCTLFFAIPRLGCRFAPFGHPEAQAAIEQI
ncbi:MAG TPA: hypothetical protein VK572_12040 [Burkholderiales bacterium]|nr:hypothetical protein [Burkholderiales bacterium]